MTSAPIRESPLRKQDLSPAQLHLLLLHEEINFGRICGLVVRDGEPVFDPPPRIQRDHKFGGQNGPRSELYLGDFVLKKEYRELFRTLAELDTGVISNLEVRGGLPFMMTVEKSAA